MTATTTTPDLFAEKTALVISVLVDRAIGDTPHKLTGEQIQWFVEHCDSRFRWFHANKPTWRKWLEDRSKRIDPRDQCIVWIRHWFAAYQLDPAGFQDKHS